MSLLQKPWWKRTIDVLPFVLISLGTALMPLFALPFTRDTLNPAKELLLYTLVSLWLIAWLAQAFVHKEFRVRRSILDVPLLCLFLALLVSFLFTGEKHIALFGRPNEVLMHINLMVPLMLWCWAIVQTVTTRSRWHKLVALLLSSTAIASLLFVLAYMPGTDVLARQFGTSLGTVNTLSVLNSVAGMIMAAMLVLCLSLFADRSRRGWGLAIPAFAAVLFAGGIVRLGFAEVWWLLAFGCLCLVAYGWIRVQATRTGGVMLAFLMLLVACIAALFGTPNALKAEFPSEITLGLVPSWEITKNAAGSSISQFFVGGGPGSFVYDFSLFRPEAFNGHRFASSLRFAQPFNSVFAVITELGLFGAVALLLLLLLPLGAVGHALRHIQKATHKGRMLSALEEKLGRVMMHEAGMDVAALTSAWLMLTAGFFLSFFDVLAWWLWWSLLALMIIGLQTKATYVIHEKRVALRWSAHHQLLFAMGIVLLFVGGGILGTFKLRFYLAERAMTAATQTSLLSSSKTLVKEAIQYRDMYAPYHVVLARLTLQEASVLAADPAQSEKVAALLAKAVAEARLATQLEPTHVQHWELLSEMYRTARPLAENANDWTRRSLQEAIKREPTNAILYWRLGGVYEIEEDWAQAARAYTKAITLFPKHIPSYRALAGVHEQSGKLTAAVETLELGIQQDPAQIELYYQLGRVLFNRGAAGDNTRAQALWERVVEEEPDHSNALYSLGLLAEKEGRKADAISYFQQVQERNPENEDLQKKINQLQ